MIKWIFAVLVACAGYCATAKAQMPLCENGRCDVVRSVVAVPAKVAGVIVGSTSSAYQQALASAQYRAANRIHGHSYLDTHRTSGVGWATSDAMPTTCLGRGGEAYAVARGADGWYSTRFATTTETISKQSLQVRRWPNPINLQTVQPRRFLRSFRR